MTNTADKLRADLDQWSSLRPEQGVDLPAMRKVAREVIEFLSEDNLSDAAAYACNDAVMFLAMISREDGNPQMNANNFALALTKALNPFSPTPSNPTTKSAPSSAELLLRLDSEFLMRN